MLLGCQESCDLQLQEWVQNDSAEDINGLQDIPSLVAFAFFFFSNHFESRSGGVKLGRIFP